MVGNDVPKEVRTSFLGICFCFLISHLIGPGPLPLLGWGCLWTTSNSPLLSQGQESLGKRSSGIVFLLSAGSGRGISPTRLDVGSFYRYRSSGGQMWLCSKTQLCLPDGRAPANPDAGPVSLSARSQCGAYSWVCHLLRALKSLSQLRWS